MTESPTLFDQKSLVYVAGHRGLVGSAVWRALEAYGCSNLIGLSSSDLDLRDREATREFIRAERPTTIIDAAARVGGITANRDYPAEFLSDNLRIQVNLLDAAAEFGVKRFLFLASSCAYPRLAEQPIREEALLGGPLEPTNDAYAIAKLAGILQVQALRRQFGLAYISAMPTNLYGPNDNFDLATSHVLPALIRRFDDAKQSGASEVTLWGSGSPLREFLHVDDLAAACITLLERYDSPEAINVGTGSDVSIRELASTVAGIVGFEGSIEWDTSKPDGTPRKQLDVSRITALGWRPQISLEDGIADTLHWYRENGNS